jgi:lysophospholipase L1-like esterase
LLSSIYGLIFDLRDGEPTIVRAMDMYNPTIADWREAGIETECTAAWEVFSQTIRDAASEYGVPTGSMFNAFNGDDHSEDPREKSFIGPDKMHTTDEGKAAMVEVLHALGYDPVSG